MWGATMRVAKITPKAVVGDSFKEKEVMALR